jgi:uncharacterized protein YjdB
MQLFSRKKAFAALSLGALFALGACGDDVTVPVAPDAPVVISITPPSATMNIGESLNFAVQITGGPSTGAPTLASCTSSNSAVATAAVQGSACRVTAVTSGNITVTAAASTGGTAAAAITVAPAAAAISNLTTSPTTAGIAVGQTLTIVPNVAKAASSVAVTYTYSTSNSSIASLNGGVVTAVAPGVATITVTANGSGTGFTTTALTAGVTVTVSAAPAAITGLTVQPTSLNMALGSTAQLTTSTQAAAGVTPTITYTPSAPSIATVSAAGLVTAVAPGTASITVTASAPATATLSAATLTQIIPVTVSPAANVTIQTITQGPTVSNVRSGSGQAVASNDGIQFTANAQVDQPVDITNTRDQIQVKVNLQPNGQRVDSVVVYIANEATPTVRRAAARQLYTSGTANAGEVGLFVNTADFTANFGAGTADVFYTNGLKIISASVFTTSSTGVATEVQNASNNRQTLNFNNIDGWAVQWNAPSRSALSTNTTTQWNYWGGPGAAGSGNYTIVPVFYTPGRGVTQVLTSIAEANLATVNNCGTRTFTSASALPWNTTYGSLTGFNFNCGTNTTSGAGYAHAAVVVASNLPAIATAANTNGTQDNFNNPAPWISVQSLATLNNGGYRTSASVVAPTAIRLDYRNPTLSFNMAPQITGAESHWVNALFSFITASSRADGQVGLVGTAPNGLTLTYTGCVTGNGGTNVSMPTGTGADVPECSNDFLGGNAPINGPYITTGTLVDVLGNTTVASSQQYGVDKTNPALTLADENTLAAAPIISRMGAAVRTNADSIFDNVTTTFTAVAAPAAAINSTNALFGVRYRDERSGFQQSNHGTRSLTRWAPAASPLLSNVSVATEEICAGSRTLNFDGVTGVLVGPNCFNQESVVDAGDPTYRRDSIAIFGNNNATTATSPGYYYYTVRVVDRAGNFSVVNRTAAIDITSPMVTGVTIPAVLQGGSQLTFNPTGVDDLEAIDGDLFLNYPTMATAGDAAADPTVIANQNGRLRYRRNHFTDWHGSWLGATRNTVVTTSDGLLSTPFGPGAALSSNGLRLPIGFYQRLEVVQAAVAQENQGPHNRPAITRLPSQPNLAAIPAHATWTALNSFKPTLLGVYAFDIRSTGLAATAVAFPERGMSSTQAPATESAYLENLFAANITQPTAVNYWGDRDIDGTTAGTQNLWSWYCFSFGSSTLECRAETGTNVVNSPFTRVDYYRWKATANVGLTVADAAATAGQWIYLGSTNPNVPVNPIIQDQGVTRFWRFLFSFAGNPVGQNHPSNTEAALATGNLMRAIGVDASGNAISTLTFTLP